MNKLLLTTTVYMQTLPTLPATRETALPDGQTAPEESVCNKPACYARQRGGSGQRNNALALSDKTGGQWPLVYEDGPGAHCGRRPQGPAACRVAGSAQQTATQTPARIGGTAF